MPGEKERQKPACINGGRSTHIFPGFELSLPSLVQKTEEQHGAMTMMKPLRRRVCSALARLTL
jgi:hypothetical protein